MCNFRGSSPHPQNPYMDHLRVNDPVGPPSSLYNRPLGCLGFTVNQAGPCPPPLEGLLWSQIPSTNLVDFNISKYSPAFTHLLHFYWTIFRRGGTYESQGKEVHASRFGSEWAFPVEKWVVLNSKRLKITFKIALPELSVYSSKKNCDALGEIHSFIQTSIYWVPIIFQASK